MKQRWLVGLLLATALTLAACTPADGGADPNTPDPAADFYDDY